MSEHEEARPEEHLPATRETMAGQLLAFARRSQGRMRTGNTWLPHEEGQELVGVVAGFEERQGPDGPYQAMMVAQADGATIGVPMNVVLRQALGEVQAGDLVRIQFRGWETSRAGRKFRAYSAYTERPAAQDMFEGE